jgi:anti-sigma factor RsiW
MNRNESSDYRALADLLPFYVTGKLPLEDVQRIEHALAEDEALRYELALVEEEQITTVHANEMLGLPSSSSAQRFFAALEAEPARTTPRALAKGMLAWIGEHLQSLAPRQMAFAGVAAALLLVAQTGFIGVLLHGKGGSTYGTASFPEDGTATAIEGSFAMVAFMPEAKVADLARLLESAHLRVVDGPRAGGFFKVRIGPKDMPKADRDAILAKLQAEKTVIRFVAPSLSQ